MYISYLIEGGCMKLKIALIVGGILAIIIVIILMRSVHKQNIQMNNPACPVSGNPVNGIHTYVHEGKEYNLCSDQCKQSLSENPQKYLFD